MVHHLCILPIALPPACNSGAMPRGGEAILPPQAEAPQAKEGGTGSQRGHGPRWLPWATAPVLKLSAPDFLLHSKTRFLLGYATVVWFLSHPSLVLTGMEALLMFLKSLHIGPCGQQAWFLKYCQPRNDCGGTPFFKFSIWIHLNLESFAFHLK